MHRRRLWPVTLLLTLPLVTTACSGSAGRRHASDSHVPTSVTATKGTDGVQHVTIDTTDNFRFAPMSIAAHVGKLRIALTDHGSYPHNISFPTLHATSSTVSGNPGQQTTTFTVTFTHPGIYQFVCTFHSSAGMRGQVTVS